MIMNFLESILAKLIDQKFNDLQDDIDYALTRLDTLESRIIDIEDQLKDLSLDFSDGIRILAESNKYSVDKIEILRTKLVFVEETLTEAGLLTDTISSKVFN